MNILFLNPPFQGRFSRASRSPAVAKGGTLYYPVWLAQAAAVSNAQGHNVRLFDAPADGLNLDDIFSRLEDFIPDIVVLDTSTGSLSSDLDCVTALKKHYSDIFSIVVGTHPTARPDETLHANHDIDCVARREYDYTIPEIACELSRPIPELSEISGGTSPRRLP